MVINAVGNKNKVSRLWRKIKQACGKEQLIWGMGTWCHVQWPGKMPLRKRCKPWKMWKSTPQGGAEQMGAEPRR